MGPSEHWPVVHHIGWWRTEGETPVELSWLSQTQGGRGGGRGGGQLGPPPHQPCTMHTAHSLQNSKQFILDPLSQPNIHKNNNQQKDFHILILIFPSNGFDHIEETLQYIWLINIYNESYCSFTN